MSEINCIEGTLSPFIPTAVDAWDEQKVRHLYSRAGYGATYAQVQAGLAVSPSDLVDQIVDQAINYPDLVAPDWIDEQDVASVRLRVMSEYWADLLHKGGLRGKLSIFWHNHFVTERFAYNRIPYMWQYFKLLWDNSLGNFKNFTMEIGKSVAMLTYLNGNTNIASDPNENYARELFELFTLGEGNGYNEVDIINSARALTGWRVNIYSYGDPYFDPVHHDSSNKFILGQTDTFDYDSLHDLIFDVRKDECAKHICRKLYKQFVYNTPSEAIVNEMAELFKVNWDISVPIRALLKSEHFYHQDAMGVRIKDHLESFISAYRLMDMEMYDASGTELAHPNCYWYYWIWGRDIGMELFAPVNVAGWPGHREWITATNYTVRKDKLEEFYTWILRTAGKTHIHAQVKQICDNSDDAVYITQELAKHFLRTDLEADRLDAALIILKGDVPENYFEDGTWHLDYPGADEQCRNLIIHLLKQPEFELS